MRLRWRMWWCFVFIALRSFRDGGGIALAHDVRVAALLHVLLTPKLVDGNPYRKSKI